MGQHPPPIRTAQFVGGEDVGAAISSLKREPQRLRHPASALSRRPSPHGRETRLMQPSCGAAARTGRRTPRRPPPCPHCMGQRHFRHPAEVVGALGCQVAEGGPEPMRHGGHLHAAQHRGEGHVGQRAAGRRREHQRAIGAARLRTEKFKRRRGQRDAVFAARLHLGTGHGPHGGIHAHFIPAGAAHLAPTGQRSVRRTQAHGRPFPRRPAVAP